MAHPHQLRVEALLAVTAAERTWWATVIGPVLSRSVFTTWTAADNEFNTSRVDVGVLSVGAAMSAKGRVS